MSTLGLIFKSMGIDRKKFFCFLILAIISFGGWKFWQSNIYKAETPIPDNIATTTANYELIFHIDHQGKIYNADNNEIAQATFEKNLDSLRFVVIKDNPTLVSQQTIDVILPIADENRDITSRINYEGTTDQQNIYYKDSKTLVFEISDIAPMSTVSISLTFPKGYFTPGATAVFKSELASYSPFLLFGIGLIIPLVTSITLLVVIIKSARRRVAGTRLPATSVLPDHTSPAVIGVLYRGQIGPREIAATLLDLANRGYLHVYRNGDEFRFAIPSYLGDERFKDIKPFEKFLLSKLFQPDKVTSDVKEIGYRIGQHLFSRKITAVMLDIYQQAVVNGYYTINPYKMHKRYKALAIIEFFLGLIGLLTTLFIKNDYQMIFVIIFISTIISSFLIFLLAPTVPQRTEAGAAALKHWLAFRKFLCKPQPIAYSDQMQEVYMNYLPYAIVFQVEVEWAQRFAKSPFKMPEWLDAPSDITNVEDFANSIYPLVGYVGAIILQSRIPIVD